MRTFVQSLFPPPEFAETAPLHEAVYLGRPDAYAPPPLRVLACGCGTPHLQRIERAWWMRLLPACALYQCLRCQRRVLRPRLRPQPAEAAWPAPRLQRGAARR